MRGCSISLYSQALSMLRHPHVLLLIGIVITKQACWVVTEYCPFGSLWDVIHHQPSLRTRVVESKLRIATQIASAMEFLHRQGICHRDLKSPNVFLAESFSVRVGDFGLSKALVAGATNTLLGTPAWSAPEVFERSSYTEKADVYAFGVVLFELDTLRQPFAGLDPIQIAIGVMQDKERLIPPADGLFYDLIVSCLQRSAAARPAFDAICMSLSQLAEG
jgi:serine/threonine protein kinase